jgi:DNA replication licensing factor MCM4
MADEELETYRTRRAEEQISELELRTMEEELREVEGRVYKTRPFGGEKTINMRDLNPGGTSLHIKIYNCGILVLISFSDTDKLVSVKGLVIRATPVIPDMSMGMCYIAFELLTMTLLTIRLLPVFGLSAHCPGRHRPRKDQRA